MKYTIDANIVLDWITLAQDTDLPVHQLYEMATDKKIELFAPSFLITEVSNVLKQRYEYTEEKVQSVIHILEQIGIIFIETPVNRWTDLLHLSYEYHLTLYDAYYLLTAIDTKSKIITSDKALLSSSLALPPSSAPA